MPEGTRIQINRAPVLTLWAAVVAERMGFDREEALTLGRTLAGLNAQSKGRMIGIYKASGSARAKPHREPAVRKPAASSVVELFDRAIPVVRTPDGIRAVDRDGHPDDPKSVERYLEGKFGDSLGAARRAMETLADSTPPAELAASAYALYESFRPSIPGGKAGWGAKGVLDLMKIRALAKR